MAISLICCFNFQSKEKYNCQYINFSALKQASKIYGEEIVGRISWNWNGHVLHLQLRKGIVLSFYQTKLT